MQYITISNLMIKCNLSIQSVCLQFVLYLCSLSLINYSLYNFYIFCTIYKHLASKMYNEANSLYQYPEYELYLLFVLIPNIYALEKGQG